MGDGVNDSPALAVADLGVAIGAGTHVAMDAADVVLINSNLFDVVVIIDLAKCVFSRIKWNMMWAVVYNLVAIPFAAGLWFPWTHMLLPPHYAGLAMAMSSISVLVSSASLRLYRRPSLVSRDKSRGVVRNTIRYCWNRKNGIIISDFRMYCVNSGSLRH